MQQPERCCGLEQGQQNNPNQRSWDVFGRVRMGANGSAHGLVAAVAEHDVVPLAAGDHNIGERQKYQNVYARVQSGDFQAQHFGPALPCFGRDATRARMRVSIFCFRFGNRAFIASVQYQANKRCLEGNGVGEFMDAAVWGVVWAMIAAIAGVGLAVAATTLLRGANAIDSLEFDGGYNALAATLDERPV